MKTQWAIAVALLFVATAAIDASAHGRRGWHHKTSLAEQLGLSADQQAQLADLKSDKMEQRQALREEYQASFEAILTAEQLDALAELKANRRKHRRVSLTDALGLGEDQVAQLQTLGEEIHARKQALREEYQAGFEAILTAEQLAAYEEFKANRRSRFGRYGDKDEAAEAASGDIVTSEATLQIPTSDAAATAVEETSWGRIKGALGQ